MIRGLDQYGSRTSPDDDRVLRVLTRHAMTARGIDGPPLSPHADSDGHPAGAGPPGAGLPGPGTARRTRHPASSAPAGRDDARRPPPVAGPPGASPARAPALELVPDP